MIALNGLHKVRIIKIQTDRSDQSGYWFFNVHRGKAASGSVKQKVNLTRPWNHLVVFKLLKTLAGSKRSASALFGGNTVMFVCHPCGAVTHTMWLEVNILNHRSNNTTRNIPQVSNYLYSVFSQRSFIHDLKERTWAANEIVCRRVSVGAN